MASTHASIGYLVKQLQQAFRARMDEALGQIALTTSQYALLTAIEEAPGSSGAELARRCFITAQSVNGLMAELQKKSLIKRSASATHGRIIETRLSQDGRAQLSLARERVYPIEGRMLEKLEQSQRQELAAVLKICIASIDG